jgi:hypothetical protein
VDAAELACLRQTSGDQFNIYICDRFIIPALTPGQQPDIGRGPSWANLVRTEALVVESG